MTKSTLFWLLIPIWILLPVIIICGAAATYFNYKFADKN